MAGYPKPDDERGVPSPTYLTHLLRQDRAKRKRRPRKRGPKPKIITEESRAKVLHMRGMGLTMEQIGISLNMSVPTLRKYYRHEIETAEPKLLFDVANNLYNIATSPDHKGAVTAAMFWLERRGGWTKSSRVEMTGADGQPIQMGATLQNTVDSRRLSADERQKLRELIMTAMRDVTPRGLAGAALLEGEYRSDDDDLGSGDGSDDDEGDDD